ncbi:Tetratricopeptide repeat (TPR)-like superfamily protein [Melia azedarach]|uniref:Tetratricopeptide repeat (TPR)-like superfamily protein n=1 Tax=Melia azedarach TaxID=155640 RepID=A0ACC1XU97_MELAZ|nr:Tetratricopeptide repeat (TPR)-like superfamily protein [Melia azedarach]
MAEEEGSVTMTEQTEKPTEALRNAQTSVDATIESAAEGGTESTCNNNNNGETSGVSADEERENTVEYSNELMERGTRNLRENDYSEAAECFSRGLEIRVAHYGELALECLNAYYQYGRALLYKAQEETDPLGSVPKKEGESQQVSDKDESVKNVVNAESSTASVSSNAEQAGSSNKEDGAEDDVPGGKDEEEDEEGNEDEDLAEADEDESDLDLAWKMLDVARAIAEKHSGDTMEKVDILSALAEVALEREDIETSLSDYQQALSILERLVEPDSRHIAELNFRICLCLEIGSKPQEAIPYCQKAISVCKSRLQRLMNEVKNSAESATSSAASELDDGMQHSSNGMQNDKLLTDKEAEIETLSSLSGDLEKKLEDLQQLALNPKSILSEILGMAAAKAKGNEKSPASVVMSSSRLGTANSSGDFDSPTVSTAHTSGAAAGVTHLGVVGRGVKRVSMSTASAESSPMKKPMPDPSSDKGDGSVC